MKKFIKEEIVLIISFFLAAASSFIVPPSGKYIDYIDFRTLALLFSLMVIMAGFNRLGIFSAFARVLISKVRRTDTLTAVLVCLCFFLSMIITNDVTLITIVPFTIVVLNIANCRKKLIYIITLETVSANLGSMLTPIGNPQNLYLYSAFDMSFGDFFLTIAPYALLSFVLLIVFSFLAGREKIKLSDERRVEIGDKRLIALYCLLFIVSLLCIMRVINYIAVIVTVVVLVLIFDRKTFLRVDYSLLFTFVFLFIFIGNLGSIEGINRFLRSTIEGNEVISGILSSQVISNVPAALLLSGFTDDAKALLIGVNLGGLGTLIASMASLISFKLVQKEKVNSAKYITVFTILNVIFLGANLILWLI